MTPEQRLFWLHLRQNPELKKIEWDYVLDQDPNELLPAQEMILSEKEYFCEDMQCMVRSPEYEIGRRGIVVNFDLDGMNTIVLYPTNLEFKNNKWHYKNE